MPGTVLDLFCGGGGAAEGYRRAGFARIIGIDIEDHAGSYEKVAGAEFHRMGWEEGLARFAAAADLVHASPPCEHYSALTRWGRAANVQGHPDLIGPTRERLEQAGLPYVIENVPGSPLKDPLELCAWTFGYETFRHRLFELGGGLDFTGPPHRAHKDPDGRVIRVASPGHFAEHQADGWFVGIGGHFAPALLCREVMDIGWMSNPELAEAIPPYFTHWLGVQVQSHLLLVSREPGPEARRLIWDVRARRPRPAAAGGVILVAGRQCGRP